MQDCHEEERRTFSLSELSTDAALACSGASGATATAPAVVGSCSDIAPVPKAEGSRGDARSGGRGVGTAAKGEAGLRASRAGPCGHVEVVFTRHNDTPSIEAWGG